MAYILLSNNIATGYKYRYVCAYKESKQVVFSLYTVNSCHVQCRGGLGGGYLTFMRNLVKLGF